MSRVCWVPIAVFTVVTVSLALDPPIVGSDPAPGLLAAEQALAGVSPSVRRVVEADPDDLERDRVRVVSETAPAYQAVPYLFRRAGLSLGGALRVTIALSTLLALVGWTLYFRVVLGARAAALAGAALALVPANPYFFVYLGGEQLIFAAFPWALLLHLRALESKRPSLAAAAGALAAALFVVKWSAALATVGLGASWLPRLRDRDSRRSAVAWALGACAVAAALWVAGFPGGETPADPGPAQSTVAALAPLGNWAAVMTGWSELGQRLRLDGALSTSIALALVLAAWLAGRPRAWSAARTTAVALVVVSALALAALVAHGSDVSTEPRHLRLAALALAPFVLDGCATAWAARGQRRAIAALAGVALAAPLLLGAGDLRAVWRHARTATPGPLGLDYPSMGGDAPAIFAELERRFAGRGALFFFQGSPLRLPFPRERTVYGSRMFGPLGYHGRPRHGLIVVFPTRLDEPERARRLGKFLDVHCWRHLTLESTAAFTVDESC